MPLFILIVKRRATIVFRGNELGLARIRMFHVKHFRCKPKRLSDLHCRRCAARV
jgi:hypothetical protein